jgi:hypothetical protein
MGGTFSSTHWPFEHMIIRTSEPPEHVFPFEAQAFPCAASRSFGQPPACTSAAVFEQANVVTTNPRRAQRIRRYYPCSRGPAGRFFTLEREKARQKPRR